MSFEALAPLAQQRPLRILLVNAGEADAISWAGLVQPLRLAAAALGRDVLHLETMSPTQVVLAQPGWHIALLVADEQQAPLSPELIRAVIERCRSADYWGGVGAGVLWLAAAGAMAGVRIALPWSLYAETESFSERAVLTPNLFALDGRHLGAGHVSELDGVDVARRAVGVVDGVSARALAEDVQVVAAAAFQVVIARASRKDIIARITSKYVVAIAAK